MIISVYLDVSVSPRQGVDGDCGRSSTLGEDGDGRVEKGKESSQVNERNFKICNSLVTSRR